MNNNEGCSFLGINIIFSGIYVSAITGSILIGFGAAVVLFCLMLVPVVQYIVQTVFGIMWGQLFYSILRLFLNSTAEKIIGCIICIAIGIIVNIAELYVVTGASLSFDTSPNVSKSTINTPSPSYPNTSPRNDLYQIMNNAYLRYNKLIETQNMVHKCIIEIFRPYHILSIEEEYKQYCTHTQNLIGTINLHTRKFYEMSEIRLMEAYKNNVINAIIEFEKLQNEFVQKLYNSHQTLKDYERYHQQQHRSEPEQRTTEKEDIYVNMFNGCSSIEELNHRYKSLMKIYHPDNYSGDNNMTLRIKDAYEKLKRKYEYC